MKLKIRKHYPGTCRVNASIENESGKILAQAFVTNKEDEAALRQFLAAPQLAQALDGLLDELSMLFAGETPWNKGAARALYTRRLNKAQMALEKYGPLPRKRRKRAA